MKVVKEDNPALHSGSVKKMLPKYLAGGIPYSTNTGSNTPCEFSNGIYLFLLFISLLFGYSFSSFAYSVRIYPVREYPAASRGGIPYSTNTGSNTPCEFSNGIYPGESPEAEIRAFNIVFCPLHYRDNRAFLKDTGTALDRLKKTVPFNEFTDKIMPYYVELFGEEEDKIFKKTGGFPPLKVRQDFLDSIKARLKSNYKLIIIDAKGSTSCAELSSVNKLSLIILGRARYKSKSSFAKGFLHELGHSLGLRDECIHCRRVQRGFPNCARTKEEAKEWWSKLLGKSFRLSYIQGCCGRWDCFRPAIASLMNNPDKAKGFGRVNEEYLRRELISILPSLPPRR